MSNFINNLTDKLSYAYEPKIYPLAALAATEITTDNTVTTLATYSSAKLKSADNIKVGYNISVTNASGNNELFTFYLKYNDTDYKAYSFTIATGGTDIFGIHADLVRMNSGAFMGTITFTGLTGAGVYSSFTNSVVLTDTDITEITINAENDTVISAGLDLIGNGGYVLVDKF